MTNDKFGFNTVFFINCSLFFLSTVSAGNHADPLHCAALFTAGLLNASYLIEDLSAFDEEQKKLDAFLLSGGFPSDRLAEGHSGEGVMLLERKLYAHLAKLPCVKSICEIGFNGGHSALNWLVANPHANVTMFDIFKYPYSSRAEQHLLQQAHLRPQRFQVLKGDSVSVVRALHTSQPQFKCDIISIDGAHDFKTATKDLMNMWHLARKPFNILLIDDTNCDSGWCVDEVIYEGLRRGIIRLHEGFSLDDSKRGISIMTFL